MQLSSAERVMAPQYDSYSEFADRVAPHSIAVRVKAELWDKGVFIQTNNPADLMKARQELVKLKTELLLWLD